MFPQETMAACENRFAPQLNEKEWRRSALLNLAILEYGMKNSSKQ